MSVNKHYGRRLSESSSGSAGPLARSDVAMPLLILFKGHPGCGKSRVAHALASKLLCPIIDKDDARDCLWPLEARFSADFNRVSYDIMFKSIETQLSLALNCVVDCPLARKQLYDRAVEVANKVRDAAMYSISLNCLHMDVP